jgi:cbb3-type cytochrome oxidase cytochrome c subunit
VWTSKVDTNGWPPKPILAQTIASASAGSGQALYRSNDCSECHQIGGIGGTAGPDLTHVGAKRPDINWHIKHLRNPESVVPDSAMPDFASLSEEQLRALAEYLVTLK